MSKDYTNASEYAKYLERHYMYGEMRKSFTLRLLQSQIDAHEDDEISLKPENDLDMLLETKDIILNW